MVNELFRENNHRDTENTEVAQRSIEIRSLPTFSFICTLTYGWMYTQVARVVRFKQIVRKQPLPEGVFAQHSNRRESSASHMVVRVR